MRLEGADGTISCMIRTEPLGDNNPNSAHEFDDYLPKHEKITFLHGETEKSVVIDLVKKTETEKSKVLDKEIDEE